MNSVLDSPVGWGHRHVTQPADPSPGERSGRWQPRDSCDRGTWPGRACPARLLTGCAWGDRGEPGQGRGAGCGMSPPLLLFG